MPYRTGVRLDLWRNCEGKKVLDLPTGKGIISINR